MAESALPDFGRTRGAPAVEIISPAPVAAAKSSPPEAALRLCPSSPRILTRRL